ncbi:unnamed protein product [Rotaria sp. Silwood2]|nr:unnamed protein product [Rotaria sp. Silwood2]CAF4524588.1 unnamed protein product [Rotaria sp. Silwood2]
MSSLRKSINQLISINSFFSTSFKQEQALAYLSDDHISHDLERVLFEIDADPAVVTTKPFADISSYSAFGTEAEVLFMYGSIFRIRSIQQNINNVWHIKMVLCGEKESDLKKVLEQMRIEYGNKKANLHLLGTVLWKMGNFGLAKKYFLRMINELPFNDPLLIDLYKDLSEIAAMTGDLDESIQYKQKALDIKAQAAHNSGAIPPKVLVPGLITGTKKPTSGATSSSSSNMYADIEQRIAQVTDSQRLPFDSTQIHKANRELKMMAAAWTMVCKFDCRLYGGFVRDWIVGNFIGRPKNKTVDQWIQYENSTAHLHPEIVPADLDCYLPAHGLYDIDEILDELSKLQMTVNVHRDQWRYLLFIDQNTPTGPFTIDLITPHIGVHKYERIDFDVNNLYVDKNHTKHLGMRIDITYAPYSITLEKIVDNIRKKRFYLLAGVENTPCGKVIVERIDKMKKRGWQQIDNALPPVVSSGVSPSNIELKSLPNTSPIYQKILQKMNSAFSGNKLEIVSIEEIKNVELQSMYEQARRIIQKQSSNPDGNEMMLYHGAKGENIEIIFRRGFIDRVYRYGNWGK